MRKKSAILLAGITAAALLLSGCGTDKAPDGGKSSKGEETALDGEGTGSGEEQDGTDTEQSDNTEKEENPAADGENLAGDGENPADEEKTERTPFC